MQTILGAGGAIGNELAKHLNNYTTRIRLVSRNPEKRNETVELFAANLLDIDKVAEAVKGSEVVYLLAGLEYKLKIWQQQWPVIMKNVIAACMQYKSKLVFFDNIYMYDAGHLHNMTEETPVNPVSKKGMVRAQIAQMILDQVRSGGLTAMIVRSADFYGPGVKNSMLMETVLKNMVKGKKAYWLGDPASIHTYTYVPDAAKATALLGNTTSAFNQVWHLPTDQQKLKGKEIMELFAKELNIKTRYSRIPKSMIRMMGFFNPLMKELYEMMYQFEKDYFFNSTKFNQHFPDFITTTYQEGIKATVKKEKSL